MVRKLAMYSLTTVSLIVTQIAAIPILISAVGAHAWAGLAVGQSIGTVAALVAQVGWPITGPTEVAMATPDQRRLIYGHSLIVRLALVPPAAMLAAAASYAAVGAETAPALSAVAATFAALSPGWYFVGVAQPGKLWTIDSVPRLVATLGGAGVVWAGAPLYWFPLALLAVPLWACLIATLQLRPPLRESISSLDRTVVRGQIPGWTQSVVSSTYKFLPLIVVSALCGPSATAAYALADRFLKLGLAGMRPMTQVLQGWVPAVRETRERERRTLLARRGTILVGFLAAVIFAALAEPLGRLMSHDAVRIAPAVAIPLGVAFGLSLVSLTSGLVLMVAQGLKRYLAVGSLIGAVIGVALIVPLTLTMSIAGAALAVAASEIAVQSYQTWRLRRGSKNAGGAVADADLAGRGAGPDFPATGALGQDRVRADDGALADG